MFDRFLLNHVERHSKEKALDRWQMMLLVPSYKERVGKTPAAEGLSQVSLNIERKSS